MGGSQPKMYLGDIRLGATIEFTFTTRATTGVPFTLAGTPSIEAYQVGSSVPITAGITLTADYSSVTGLNHVSIVATSGNGFATAKDVSVVIAAGTVNSVSVVGETIGAFSIENRSALMPTTSGRTLVVDAAGLADANMVKVGPTGSGTAQTARDIGASVLLSSGTGTGQILLSSGKVATPDDQKVDVNTIKTRAVAASGTVTFQTGTLPITTDTVLADVRKINNVTVIGAGTSGDLWRA